MKKPLSTCSLFQKLDFTTNVYVYLGTKQVGDDFDPYEKNYIYTNLNPIIVKAYVQSISPEQAFYKQYGRFVEGAKEIICEKRFKDLFVNSTKVVIDDIEYQTFKDSGKKMLIIDRPLDLIKVVVWRNE